MGFEPKIFLLIASLDVLKVHAPGAPPPPLVGFKCPLYPCPIALIKENISVCIDFVFSLCIIFPINSKSCLTIFDIKANYVEKSFTSFQLSIS